MSLDGRKTPCKDCKNRHYLCHSDCEAYNEFIKERKEISRKRRINVILTSMEMERKKYKRD